MKKTEVTIIGVGTTSIIASQAGNSDYESASEISQSLVATKADAIITFYLIPEKTYGDIQFDLNTGLVIASTSNQQIMLTSSYDLIATIVDNTIINITGAGTAIITARQLGTTLFHPAVDISQTLNVKKADQSILNFNSIATKTMGDPAFFLNALYIKP